MADINYADAPGGLTRGVLETYTDEVEAPGYFSSMAAETEDDTFEVAVETSRAVELVAKDTERGTNGNRNEAEKSTVNVYVPPFYHETIDLTSMDAYNRVAGQEATSPSTLANLLDATGRKMAAMVNKISRAKELQWSQVMQTGIVTMRNGDNLDFRRKAASIVDVNVAGDYWNVATATIVANIQAGCKFLKEVGKAKGSIFNMTMGAMAFNAFITSTEILNLGDNANIKLVNIQAPSDGPEGGAFSGQLSVGSYKVNIWTYPSSYDVVSGGTKTPTTYLDDTKVVLTPVAGSRFTTKYAATPKIIKLANANPMFSRYVSPVAGKLNMYDAIDEQLFSHLMGVMSAFVAVPVSVDQIYTLKVLA